MFTKAVLLSVLVALADARFGQEQVPIQAIANVKSGGAPGVAATLAGAAISDLLAAANPCSKLQKADEIIAQLGTGADSIAAARGLVAAEQNFNPFAVSIPSICSDPTLPKSEQLRGVVPLVDPAVGGSDLENKNQALSLQTPFNAAGMSVAQVMAANGFSNFTTKDLSGAVGQPPAGGNGPPLPLSSSPPCSNVADPIPTTSTTCLLTVTVTVTPTPAPAAATAASDCPTTMVTVTVQASSAASAPAANSSATSPPSGGVQKSTIAGLDFGLCVPTMKFEPGLNGRKDTEFTFQAIDPLVNKGQQEALNPNIITNRICDQLTNVCNANDAAKQACQSAKAQISALNTRNADTANTWNSVLGFARTNINPDNAPQSGLVGHT